MCKCNLKENQLSKVVESFVPGILANSYWNVKQIDLVLQYGLLKFGKNDDSVDSIYFFHELFFPFFFCQKKFF